MSDKDDDTKEDKDLDEADTIITGSTLDEGVSVRVDDEGETEDITTGTTTSLPGGTKFGNMIHEIFEKLDFGNLKSNPKFTVFKTWYDDEKVKGNNVIETALKQYGMDYFDDGKKKSVYKLVWWTLHTKLPNVGKIYKIPNMYKELEFDMGLGSKSETPFAGCIDMLFEADNKIYILDWKTNRSEKYDEADIKAIMNDHQYYLQYMLYRTAANKWLEECGIEKKVAGAFYVFVRPAEQGKRAAVYFDDFINEPIII